MAKLSKIDKQGEGEAEVPAEPKLVQCPNCEGCGMVEKTGGFTCGCCGRNAELIVDGRWCNECASSHALSTASAPDTPITSEQAINCGGCGYLVTVGQACGRCGSAYISEQAQRAAHRICQLSKNRFDKMLRLPGPDEVAAIIQSELNQPSQRPASGEGETMK